MVTESTRGWSAKARGIRCPASGVPVTAASIASRSTALTRAMSSSWCRSTYRERFPRSRRCWRRDWRTCLWATFYQLLNVCFLTDSVREAYVRCCRRVLAVTTLR